MTDFVTRDVAAVTTPRRRLSARTARLVLAREMWVRDHDCWDYSAWDDDELPTTVYEQYIAKADVLIRDEMEVEDGRR